MGKIDSTDDNNESHDALARRVTSEKTFRDIDALITQFKSVFERAKALWKNKAVPWKQQGVKNGKLDRKLSELRDMVYTWRDSQPHGKDKWTLFLSLKEDKEQQMDKWTCRRETENM